MNGAQSVLSFRHLAHYRSYAEKVTLDDVIGFAAWACFAAWLAWV
jgi:hypothetical protein